MGSLQLLVLASRTNQPCQPTPSFSWCLLRRPSPCPAPPPTPHVQCQQLLARPESSPTAPSVPPVRSALGRREGPASGRRRRRELVSVPVASSVVEKSV